MGLRLGRCLRERFLLAALRLQAPQPRTPIAQITRTLLKYGIDDLVKNVDIPTRT